MKYCLKNIFGHIVHEELLRVSKQTSYFSDNNHPNIFFIAAIEESKNMRRIHAIENKYRIEITGRLCTKTELEAISFFIFRQIIAVKMSWFFSARVVRNRKECKY